MTVIGISETVNEIQRENRESERVSMIDGSMFVVKMMLTRASMIMPCDAADVNHNNLIQCNTQSTSAVVYLLLHLLRDGRLQ